MDFKNSKTSRFATGPQPFIIEPFLLSLVGIVYNIKLSESLLIPLKRCWTTIETLVEAYFLLLSKATSFLSTTLKLSVYPFFDISRKILTHFLQLSHCTIDFS